MRRILSILALTALFVSCTELAKEKTAEGTDHNLLFKDYLQGMWLDDFTEQPVLKVQGDSIYTSGRFDVPSYFTVKGDTLIVSGTESITYYIKHLEEYSLQFYTSIGDLISLHKSSDADTLFSDFSVQAEPETKEVTEKDSVFMYQGKRYRGYVYINPSTKKVIRPGMTEEGLIVDKVYFDNVIHICVYQGTKKICSKDIHREMLEGVVPEEFLKVAILSDMNFIGVSSQGFHYQATVGVPNGMSCYYVDLLIDSNSQVSYTLKQ